MARLSHSGSTNSLRRSLFPLGFAGEVMSLILETWGNFCLHQDINNEVPITALFHGALKKAYTAAGRNWFVTLEDPITDPNFGTELGRNDLRFYPPEHYGQTIYFTVECKRLRVKTACTFKHLAKEYVSEGIVRFVSSQYSAGLLYGGMIGYVMDNQVNKAFISVKEEIHASRNELKISSPDSLCVPSSTLRNHKWSGDTFHYRSDGLIFTLHHVFLRIKRKPKPH